MRTLKITTITSLILTITTSSAAQDSLNVSLVQSWCASAWNNHYDILVDNDLALVATGSSGLRLVDIADPGNCSEVGFFQTPVSAYKVALNEDAAFVLDCSSGVNVIDISDPAHPTQISCITYPGPASDFALENDRLYIAQGDSGIRVIDISDVYNPEEIGLYWYESCNISDIAVEDTIIVAIDQMYVRIFNAADPANIVEIGSYFYPNCSLFNAMLHSGYAYFSDNWFYCTYILDIGDPTCPAFAVGIGNDGPIWGYTVFNDHLYVSSGCLINIYDVSDPYNCFEVGTCEPYGYTQGMYGSEDLLYCIGMKVDLEIFDASDPGNLVKLGEFGRSGDICHIELSGDYLYVAESYSGLRVLDVSDVGNPLDIGLCELDSYNQEIVVEGDYAFLPNNEDGLWIVNVSDPTDPFVQTVYNPDNTMVVDVCAEGDYAYLGISVNDNHMLQVLDVSDVNQPVCVGCLDFLYYLNDMDVCGNYVSILRGSMYSIIDVSDPENPWTVGNRTADFNFCLTATEDFVYVGGESGMQCIDVTDPTYPVALNPITTDDLVYEIAAAGNGFVYAAVNSCGLEVIDVRNPGVPVETGHYDRPDYAYSVVANGSYALLARTDSIDIFDCSAAVPVKPEPPYNVPTSFDIQVHPNPFNPSTTLTFQLPVAGFVELEVFDINGRSVGARLPRPYTVGFGESRKSLTTDLHWYPPGTHNILFDGTGLPSGVYLARLKAGNWSQVQKLVLLK